MRKSWAHNCVPVKFSYTPSVVMFHIICMQKSLLQTQARTYTMYVWMTESINECGFAFVFGLPLNIVWHGKNI